MDKRITRLSVSVLKEGKEILGSYKWNRGSQIIKSIYEKLKVEWIIENLISFEDFYDCVISCKENSNVIYMVDKDIDLVFRRWSYHKKTEFPVDKKMTF